MKLVLRAAFTLGVSALFAGAALSDTPPAKTPLLPQPPAAAKAAPASTTTGSCGCSADGAGRGGRSRLFGGLSGRMDAASDRVDRMMQAREERSQRTMEMLKQIAGPPVNPQPAAPFGQREPRMTSQPGTVVFPQHPFARSPRDFFMQD